MMTGEELQMFDLSSKPPVHELSQSGNSTALKAVLSREHANCGSGMTKYGAADYTRQDFAQAEAGKSKKLKKPRRILHFSDGTLEEYSTEDEEETDSKPETLTLSDPKALTWGPWIYYWMLYSGGSMLSACDYMGERLANFLGITSPKYQYEIDEYHRAMEEEEKMKKDEEAEMAGWTTTEELSTNTADVKTVSSDPTSQPAQSPSNAVAQTSPDKSQNTSNLQTEEQLDQDSLMKASGANADSPSSDWQRF